MSYCLSFSPEFFFAEGEPYDRSDHALNSDGKPVSVWSAIELALADNETRVQIASYVLPEGSNPDWLTAEAVLSAIEATDACTDLSSPVEVWIDSTGSCTLEVWDDD